MDGRNRFTINVDVSGVKMTPTTPSSRQLKKPTEPRSELTPKNHAFALTTTSAALSVGKTYITAQFSKSEKTNKANRFNFGLRLAGYGGGMAGGYAAFGPAGLGVGAIVIGADVINQTIQYNTQLEKMQLKYDYVNEKYRQGVSNGSRFGGGSL
jgi:hypothetical protein